MRAKLVEAREKRRWTQEEAAKRIGVDATTLQNWEYGKSRPRGYNKTRLCEVYEADLYALGLEGNGATDSRSVALPGSNFLETKLLTVILQWPRNSYNYSELQRKLKLEIEVDMTNEMSRRRALELMATLPISVFGLSPLKAVAAVAAEEVLPWMSSGIVGCWGLGRGSDLTLAAQIVSSYIPTLTVLAAQPRYRKPAANLAAQAWLLRATLGWHTETLSNALQYAQEAEHYAKLAEDHVLQLDALHRLGMAYYYSKRYDQALAKLQEAEGIIKSSSDIPRTLPRTLYMDLATYQACNGRNDEALQSMEKAYKYFGAQSDSPTAALLGYDEPDTLRWEGLALSHLGDHGSALDSYRQIGERRESIAERIRVELIMNQLHSKLKTKGRDLEECVKLWTEAITGAKDLQSEQRYNEAISLLETMECVWPGEKRIAELKLLLAHW